jgi:AcrR family transcriptional regulator
MAQRISRQLLRRQETRRRLMDAAMQVWARHGYEACAVEAVAREAGLSKGAVYFHFRSKEDLLLEVVELQLWRDQQRVLELATAEGPLGGLRRLLDPGRTLSEAADPWPRLLQEFWSAAARNPQVAFRLQEMYRKRREILSRHLSEHFQTLGTALQMPSDEVCGLFMAVLYGVVVQQAIGSGYGEDHALNNRAHSADICVQDEPLSDQRGDGGYRPAIAGRKR